MDRYIRTALDAAATIREIYVRVANVRHSDDWHPLMVICDNCGRIGTTIITGWDGERVRYECRPDLREWAKGCGHIGEASPFGGNAKLPYNVDWAAKWDLFGVTIEPAGKDLSTKGGSRDRSDAIAREVFGNEPPRNVPYEFLNIGGRKMSTSKGLGASATGIADVIPPEQLRLLFLRPKPNTAIEFDPDGTDAIPRLFDESDRLAAAAAGREVRGELPADHVRVFAYSLVEPDANVAAEAATYRPAFSHLALLEQVPGVNVVERVTAEKGSPLSPREAALLDERRKAARAWLATYAPDAARIAVRNDFPTEAADLTDTQREYLRALAQAEAPTTGEAWQALIFGTAKERGLSAGDAFRAVYLAFLGRANGPRAGWLLASLQPEFVAARLREAASA
jgi:lysyl-tRNA synthetase, class I